jgi:hypothetical protein
LKEKCHLFKHLWQWTLAEMLLAHQEEANSHSSADGQDGSSPCTFPYPLNRCSFINLPACKLLIPLRMFYLLTAVAL